MAPVAKKRKGSNMATSWLRKLCGVPFPRAGHKHARLLARLDVEELDARIVPQATTWASGVGADANPCVTASLTRAASNHIPQPVTITITKGLGDFTPGTFSAAGGIADSGVYQLIDERDTAVPSPVVGTAHDTLGLAGTQGAITIRSEAVFSVVSFDPFVIGEDGHWLIASGTGAYGNLMGD